MTYTSPVSKTTKKTLLKDILVCLLFFGGAFLFGHSFMGWFSIIFGTIGAGLLCLHWAINRYLDEDAWLAAKRFMDSIREEQQKDDSIEH